jgi:hypothetical protein
MSLQFAALEPAGTAMFARRMRPSPALSSPLLRPVDLAASGVDSDAYAALPRIVARTRISQTRVHQGLDRRTVKISPHDTHPFAIRPVELACQRP